MLIALGGLPGVGKTTVARELASRLRAAHVRIDAFEAALVTTGLVPAIDLVGPAGYDVALAGADSCLGAGTDVIADAVFPIAASREPWSALASRHRTPVRWFRLVCTDPAEHRRRVEHRRPDLPGQVVPDWPAVTARFVDDWTHPHTVVDTGTDTDPVGTILRALG